MAVPTSKIEVVIATFNSIHSSLQFTSEIGHKTINFLDTTIMIRNNRILFDWFHKPTFSGRYLNYLSQHPFSQKKGMIIELVDKIFLLLHPEFHQKNFAFIIRVLLANDYPLRLIFNTIGSKIKSLINDKTIQQNNNKDNEPSNNKKNLVHGSISNPFRISSKIL